MISLRPTTQTQVALVRPGATCFDEQGRMKGSLDVPLSDEGHRQVDALSHEFASMSLDAIYSAPCQSAIQTATRLAAGRDLRPKIVDSFRNLDHGLWHGKLIDEIKRNQPKLYRSLSESPHQARPPGGESLGDASARTSKAIRKLLKKHPRQFVALIIPDPLASLIASELTDEPMPDWWKIETDAGRWQMIHWTC